jgi:orotate phosphoribosyltransferase-like protein
MQGRLSYIVRELYKLGVIKLIKKEKNKNSIEIKLELIPTYPHIYSELIDIWIKKLSGLTWDVTVGVGIEGITYASTMSYLLNKPLSVLRKHNHSYSLSKGIVTSRRILLVAETLKEEEEIKNVLRTALIAGGIPVGVTCLIDYETTRIKWDELPFIPLIRASKILEILVNY